jgi:hypothetical protein
MRICGRVSLLLIPFFVCGCVKTVRQRAAVYYPGTVPTTQPVPSTGIYSIRFIDANGRKFAGIPSSHVLLDRGQPIGFAVDEEGKLRGIAGTYSFPLDTPADYGLVWSSTDRRPTQFGKEVGKVAEGSTKVMAIVGVGGILIMGVAGGVLHPLDLLNSDDDCELPSVASRPVPR